MKRIYERSKDTAVKIREALKKAYPELPANHFKVTTQTYSGGSSISVHFDDYPLDENEVNILVRKFNSATFDGSIDLEEVNGYNDSGFKVVGTKYIFASRHLSNERSEVINKIVSNVTKLDNVSSSDYNQIDRIRKYVDNHLTLDLRYFGATRYIDGIEHELPESNRSNEVKYDIDEVSSYALDYLNTRLQETSSEYNEEYVKNKVKEQAKLFKDDRTYIQNNIYNIADNIAEIVYREITGDRNIDEEVLKPLIQSRLKKIENTLLSDFGIKLTKVQIKKVLDLASDIDVLESFARELKDRDSNYVLSEIDEFIFDTVKVDVSKVKLTKTEELLISRVLTSYADVNLEKSEIESEFYALVLENKKEYLDSIVNTLNLSIDGDFSREFKSIFESIFESLNQEITQKQIEKTVVADSSNRYTKDESGLEADEKATLIQEVLNEVKETCFADVRKRAEEKGAILNESLILTELSKEIIRVSSFLIKSQGYKTKERVVSELKEETRYKNLIESVVGYTATKYVLTNDFKSEMIKIISDVCTPHYNKGLDVGMTPSYILDKYENKYTQELNLRYRNTPIVEMTEQQYENFKEVVEEETKRILIEDILDSQYYSRFDLFEFNVDLYNSNSKYKNSTYTTEKFNEVDGAYVQIERTMFKYLGDSANISSSEQGLQEVVDNLKASIYDDLFVNCLFENKKQVIDVVEEYKAKFSEIGNKTLDEVKQLFSLYVDNNMTFEDENRIKKEISKKVLAIKAELYPKGFTLLDTSDEIVEEVVKTLGYNKETEYYSNKLLLGIISQMNYSVKLTSDVSKVIVKDILSRMNKNHSLNYVLLDSGLDEKTKLDVSNQIINTIFDESSSYYKDYLNALNVSDTEEQNLENIKALLENKGDEIASISFNKVVEMLGNQNLDTTATTEETEIRKEWNQEVLNEIKAELLEIRTAQLGGKSEHFVANLDIASYVDLPSILEQFNTKTIKKTQYKSQLKRQILNKIFEKLDEDTNGNLDLQFGVVLTQEDLNKIHRRIKRIHADTGKIVVTDDVFTTLSEIVVDKVIPYSYVISEDSNIFKPYTNSGLLNSGIKHLGDIRGTMKSSFMVETLLEKYESELKEKSKYKLTADQMKELIKLIQDYAVSSSEMIRKSDVKMNKYIKDINFLTIFNEASKLYALSLANDGEQIEENSSENNEINNAQLKLRRINSNQLKTKIVEASDYIVSDVMSYIKGSEISIEEIDKRLRKVENIFINIFAEEIKKYVRISGMSYRGKLSSHSSIKNVRELNDFIADFKIKYAEELGKVATLNTENFARLYLDSVKSELLRELNKLAEQPIPQNLQDYELIFYHNGFSGADLTTIKGTLETILNSQYSATMPKETKEINGVKYAITAKQIVVALSNLRFSLLESIKYSNRLLPVLYPFVETEEEKVDNLQNISKLTNLLNNIIADFVNGNDLFEVVNEIEPFTPLEEFEDGIVMTIIGEVFEDIVTESKDKKGIIINSQITKEFFADNKGNIVSNVTELVAKAGRLTNKAINEIKKEIKPKMVNVLEESLYANIGTPEFKNEVTFDYDEREMQRIAQRVRGTMSRLKSKLTDVAKEKVLMEVGNKNFGTVFVKFISKTHTENLKAIDTKENAQKFIRNILAKLVESGMKEDEIAVSKKEKTAIKGKAKLEGYTAEEFKALLNESVELTIATLNGMLEKPLTMLDTVELINKITSKAVLISVCDDVNKAKFENNDINVNDTFNEFYQDTIGDILESSEVQGILSKYMKEQTDVPKVEESVLNYGINYQELFTDVNGKYVLEAYVLLPRGNGKIKKIGLTVDNVIETVDMLNSTEILTGKSKSGVISIPLNVICFIENVENKVRYVTPKYKIVEQTYSMLNNPKNLVEILRNKVMRVVFKKKNGEYRTMVATRNAEIIDYLNRTENLGIKEQYLTDAEKEQSLNAQINGDYIIVYDIVAKGFRTFKPSSVLDFDVDSDLPSILIFDKDDEQIFEVNTIKEFNFTDDLEVPKSRTYSMVEEEEYEEEYEDFDEESDIDSSDFENMSLDDLQDFEEDTSNTIQEPVEAVQEPVMEDEEEVQEEVQEPVEAVQEPVEDVQEPEINELLKDLPTVTYKNIVVNDLIQALLENKVKVIFRKAPTKKYPDGELREMIGTRNLNYVELENEELETASNKLDIMNTKESIASELQVGTIQIFDLEKNDSRKFTLARLISYQIEGKEEIVLSDENTLATGKDRHFNPKAENTFITAEEMYEVLRNKVVAVTFEKADKTQRLMFATANQDVISKHYVRDIDKVKYNPKTPYLSAEENKAEQLENGIFKVLDVQAKSYRSFKFDKVSDFNELLKVSSWIEFEPNQMGWYDVAKGNAPLSDFEDVGKRYAKTSTTTLSKQRLEEEAENFKNYTECEAKLESMINEAISKINLIEEVKEKSPRDYARYSHALEVAEQAEQAIQDINNSNHGVRRNVQKYSEIDVETHIKQIKLAQALQEKQEELNEKMNIDFKFTLETSLINPNVKIIKESLISKLLISYVDNEGKLRFEAVIFSPRFVISGVTYKVFADKNNLIHFGQGNVGSSILDGLTQIVSNYLVSVIPSDSVAIVDLVKSLKEDDIIRINRLDKLSKDEKIKDLAKENGISISKSKFQDLNEVIAVDFGNKQSKWLISPNFIFDVTSKKFVYVRKVAQNTVKEFEEFRTKLMPMFNEPTVKLTNKQKEFLEQNGMNFKNKMQAIFILNLISTAWNRRKKI